MAQPPLGIRHRNYLNVKNDPDNPWIGSTGMDARGHAIFHSPEHGLRAAIIVLRTYWFTHGLHTVQDIINRWAPATDTEGSIPGGRPNDPDGYARFVARRVGVTPDENLGLFGTDRRPRDVVRLRSLVSAMAAHEIGGGFEVPADEFTRALAMVTASPTPTAAPASPEIQPRIRRAIAVPPSSPVEGLAVPDAVLRRLCAMSAFPAPSHLDPVFPRVPDASPPPERLANGTDFPPPAL